jgi:hypothetical protein
MRPPDRTLALAALATSLLLALALGRRAVPGRGPRGTAPGAGAAGERPAPPAEVPGGAPGFEPALPTGAEGWEEAAETVALDLEGLVLGRPLTGAYEEARAEAARRDLALYPPDPARLRGKLLSPRPFDRILALAALGAGGPASDELVSIALRSARPSDGDLLRLLLAELAVALPPVQSARHEDALLRAFEREPSPLVLAVALPALERLEAPRLRALVEAQLGVAAPEMVPVLAGLARDRLGPDALRAVGISVFVRETGAAGGE